MKIAFLRILNPSGVRVNKFAINRELRGMGFEKVLPFEKYTPNRHNHRFIVWRFRREDKLTDDQVLDIVGELGNVLYIWECPRCHGIVKKYEWPADHRDDIYLGCDCPGTTWGCPVF